MAVNGIVGSIHLPSLIELVIGNKKIDKTKSSL